MFSFCMNCRKNTEKKNLNVIKAKNKRIMLSKCEVCDSRNLIFIKEQKTSGLLSRNKDTFKSNSFSRFAFVLGVLSS